MVSRFLSYYVRINTAIDFRTFIGDLKLNSQLRNNGWTLTFAQYSVEMFFVSVIYSHSSLGNRHLHLWEISNLQQCFSTISNKIRLRGCKQWSTRFGNGRTTLNAQILVMRKWFNVETVWTKRIPAANVWTICARGRCGLRQITLTKKTCNKKTSRFSCIEYYRQLLSVIIAYF